MSGKPKNKGSYYDSHTNTVVTSGDDIDEQLKHKVSRVLEVFPLVSKDDAILVLQHFSNDEDSAVNALMENGATDILKHWTHLKTGPKTNIKPKKKKNKKKKGQVAIVGEETENSSDNSHNIGDDQIATSQEEETEMFKFCNQKTERTSDSSEDTKIVPPAEIPLQEVETIVESQASASTKTSSASNSPQSDAAKYVSRDRRCSSGSSRTASFSEDASRHSTPLSSTSSCPAGQGKQSLERSMKDLSRQSVSLQRVNNLLEEQFDASFKRIKMAVSEAKKLLEERNRQLEEEMEKVKKDARELLSQRKELAAELKRRSERVSTMTENELSDLRADIKNFVVERKLDDDLGRTTRFMWDKDRITTEIMAFGEITHVKNCYSQRRQSTSSIASSSTIVTSTHSDPLGSQVSESPAGDETSAAEGTTEQKDDRQQQQGFSNRPRVFVGRDYQANSRQNHRPPYHPGSRGRIWGGPRSSVGARREEGGYWSQPTQHYPKYPPHQPKVNNSDTPDEGAHRTWEYRPPYRGNRPPRYRGRGPRGPRYDNYNRTRHPSKDTQMNGEAPKPPADSSNIANGVVAH